jgi:hypothetical protein
MGWWSRLWRRGFTLAHIERSSLVRLTLPGWSEGPSDKDMRIWRDSDGDVLSLTFLEKGLDFPHGSGETKLRSWCREIAQSREGGLIEVQAMACEIGPSVGFIYKRMQLQDTGYVYTGMFITSVQSGSLLWTIVARERGTSGLREAIVTGNLIKAGKLTLDDYERCWAQDPYEPAYQGVDRIVLRFVSDDKSYDDQFPWHPLSKVRRVMADLPDNVRFDSQKASNSSRS